MAMSTVNVLGALPGKLWSGQRTAALLASCSNSKSFTTIASCSITGKTAAADKNGSVFLFDCCANSWRRLHIANRISVTGLAFLYQGRELGICLSDGRLLVHRLMDGFTRTFRVSPRSESNKKLEETKIVSDPYYCDMFCTYSPSKIIIWSSVQGSESWKQFRVLSSESGTDGEFVDVQQCAGKVFVLFSRTILAWTLPSFEFYFKLDLRKDYEDLTCISVKEGMIVGGGGRNIYMWELLPNQPTLSSVIELPAKRIVSVQILQSDQLVVLGDDGRCLILNNGTESCVVDVDIGGMDLFKHHSNNFSGEVFASFEIDDKGRFLTLLHRDQTNISFFNLKVILRKDKHVVSMKKKNKHSELPDLSMNLSLSQVRSFLLKQKQFPDKYRELLWRFLLKLPRNEKGFAQYLERGVHPCFADIPSRYPLRDSRQLRKFHLILSALAYWSPLCAELEHLPAIVFPFMMFFGSDDLAAFETCITFMVQVQKGFLVSFPHPPIPLLAAIDSIISHQDKELAVHLSKLKVGPQIYAWPILRTCFTEVLESKDWLCLFDHIFAWHQHSFILLLAVAAFILSQRSKLMKMKNTAQLECWVHETHCGDINAIIELLHHLKQDHATRSLLVKLSGELPPDEDDTLGEYPQLRGYPEFALDFQEQERERLAQEESTNLKKNKMVEEMTKRMNDIEVAEKLWKEAQCISSEVDSARQKHMMLIQDRSLEAAVHLHSTNQTIRLEHVLEKEMATQASVDASNKLRDALSKREEEELIWASRRASTLSSMKHEETSINKQVSKVLSRIKGVEDTLKTEDERRAQQAEAMLKRSSMLNAEKAMLEEWELEDAEAQLEATAQDQRPTNTGTTATQDNMFDIKAFLRERQEKVQSATEVRRERMEKDVELRSLLLDTD